MLAMEIAYELTEKDFMEAYAAHRKRGSAIKTIKTVLFWILIAFLSYVTYRAVRGHHVANLLPFCLFAVLWIVIVGEILPRWLIRRQFTKQPGAHGPRSLVLDASGAHWRWNGGSADIEWRNYILSLEDSNQILLYTSPACFNILPKRALAPEQLDTLRELLRQNIRGTK